jgi:hypothetical protein
MKNIILKKGYNTIVEGSYISKGATKKRENGEYKDYEVK